MKTMHRAIKALTLIVASILMGACHEGFIDDPTNDNNSQKPVDDTIEMTFVAESHSRMGLAITDCNWQKGDKIVVIENSARHAKSMSATIDDTERARFDVTFTRVDNTNTFTYDAIYPAESVTIGKSIDSKAVNVTLPAEQHPTATSFDPQADILVAERITSATQPNELNIRFKRLVALGALTLENMPTKSKISSVAISMQDDITLAGDNIINCLDGRVSEVGYGHPSSSLLLIYDTPHDASAPIYFTCNPTTLGEGDKFTITVTTADNTKYKRTVTIPQEQSLKFTTGELSTFNVDMGSDDNSEGDGDDDNSDNGENKEDNNDNNQDEDVEDDYVDDNKHTFRRVNSVTSGKTYLLAAEGHIATPIIDKEYGYMQIASGDSYNDGIITLDNCDNAFIIEATDGGYTLRQVADGRYLYLRNNYNSFNLSTSLSEAYTWDISSRNDGSFAIINTTKNKFIQYNNAYTSFGCYAELQEDGYYPMLYELDGDIIIDDTPQDDDSNKEDDNGDNIPDITPGDDWYEMPATPSSERYPNAVTVSVMDGSERNYTHYYDKSTYTTMWVAYPLENKHMGSSHSRPNSWTWNPFINIAYQVDLRSHSYTNSDTYVRGHLIPNASRNGIRNMQLQTFYVTNSVPQIHNGFNGGIWQSLEAALQSIAHSERIYIVTGVAFSKEGENRSISYTTAKDDTKQVPIPNYFYKVVLKVNTNSSGGVTGASTVGFWFENKAYSDSTYESHTATVDQIEQWTGFDFFVNLPDAIESSAEQNSSWNSFREW